MPFVRARTIHLMRFMICILFALSVSRLATPAQTAVLIGLHLNSRTDEKGTSHPPSYRSLLITFRNGRAQLAADIPDLVVPRKAGFWRVGSLHTGDTCCGY